MSILSQRIPDCLFLIPPLNSQAVILDLCTRKESSVFCLSQYVKSIVIIETNLKNTKVLFNRKIKEGIQNLYPIVSSILSMPFAENYFDLIIINYKYLNDRLNNPTETQAFKTDLLKTVYRHLKPGGTALIEIENNNFFRTILEMMENVGKKLSKTKSTGNEIMYSNKNHFNIKECVDVLKNIGFTNIKIYACLIDQNRYFMIPTISKEVFNFYNEIQNSNQRIRFLFELLLLIENSDLLFANSFVISAMKEKR
jgi:ubiquinone/menaquinone biosynthesis C-methylase UbiE